MKINSVSWIHTDDNLRKESSDIAQTGNTIELQAEFENYIEGASVDFNIYGIVDGAKKQLAKISTRCKNMAASAEWVVDISEYDANNPGLEFECEVRDKRSDRKPIETTMERSGGFCIYLRDQYDYLITNAQVKIIAGEIEVFSGIVADGILEIKELPESELSARLDINGRIFSQPVGFIYGAPPYIPQIITIDIDSKEQE